MTLQDNYLNKTTCIMNNLWIDKDLTSNQIIILGILLTHDTGGSPIPISVTSLVKSTGLSKDTIVKALRALVRHKHLVETTKPRGAQCRCVKIISPYIKRAK